MSRFSFGDNPLSQALRAWTISASAPAATTLARQRIERHFRILIVDADPALHRDRNAHRALHRRDAVGDQRRLRHQAGAETAVLHPVRRTADIEIDFVIAEILADFRRRREIARIGAAELQRHRMFAGIETEQAPPIAMKDGAGRQHLRIKPAPAASSGDGTRGNAGRSNPSSGRRKIDAVTYCCCFASSSGLNSRFLDRHKFQAD